MIVGRLLYDYHNRGVGRAIKKRSMINIMPGTICGHSFIWRVGLTCVCVLRGILN